VCVRAADQVEQPVLLRPAQPDEAVALDDSTRRIQVFGELLIFRRERLRFEEAFLNATPERVEAVGAPQRFDVLFRDRFAGTAAAIQRLEQAFVEQIAAGTRRTIRSSGRGEDSACASGLTPPPRRCMRPLIATPHPPSSPPTSNESKQELAQGDLVPVMVNCEGTLHWVRNRLGAT
jgi:hypothetical protein